MKPFIVITSVLLLLAACNTIEGAGEDINKAGTAISNTAKKVEKKM